MGEKEKEREREKEREKVCVCERERDADADRQSSQTQTQTDNHIRSYFQDAQDRTENEADQKRGDGRALHLPRLAVLGLFFFFGKISAARR